MPKYRQLHTKIIDSFDFSEMPDDFTRLFWILLIVVVDSEGRGINNPSWIRSRMFPLRDDVTTDQIEAAINWLNDRRMITVYEVGGRSYFDIPTFKIYQSGTNKEASSNIPANPDLLRTYSEPTPELGRVNTDSDSDADADTKQKQIQQPAAAAFAKFQNEIGMLTPKTSEIVGGWIDDYSDAWVCDAIDEAVRNNARKPNYIDAILKRWKTDGRNGSKPAKTSGKEAVWVDEVDFT